MTYADLFLQTKIQATVFELLTQQYETAKVQEAKEIPSVKVLDARSSTDEEVVSATAGANDSRNAAWLGCRDDVGRRKDALGRSGCQPSEESFCDGSAYDDAHEFATVFAERNRHGFEWKFPVDVAEEVFERAGRESYGRRRYREVGKSVRNGLAEIGLGHIRPCK